MLSIRIQGGLGNQLFMVFVTIAYGIQKNVKIVYEYYYEILDRHTYWETILDGFKIFTTENPANNITNEDISKFKVYQEPDFIYNSIPDFGNNNVCLNGYFQSYKYFEMYKEQIISLMKLNDKKEVVLNESKYSKYFEKKENTNLISIHFRMGDYKQKRYYHPIMNYEYFESSLDYIVNNMSNSTSTLVRILYFCEAEDNEYVKSKIYLLNMKYPDAEFMKVDDSIEDYDQLLIMSLCNHNIMSNSSYSWWGSYFNSYDAKIVCYPSVWFGESFEKTNDHKDMMPESWIKIESNPIHWNLPLV
jgi:hypothetical protein